MGNAPVYMCWRSMVRRCTDPRVHNYHRYAGRGIVVCERWQTFENFYADMGDQPAGLTLERKDNNKNYEPNNCIWATPMAQANNRRSNKLITALGRTQTLAQWCRETGLRREKISNRLKRGWSEERAVTEASHR